MSGASAVTVICSLTIACLSVTFNSRSVVTFFFFSSRRRHTRYIGDWNSDVCSSDLVLWIEAAGNYACIHTAKHSHLLRETLAHLEEKLSPHHFIRVRKSTIVNGACISEIRPMFDGV